MERRLRHHRGERFARHPRRARPRLERRQTPAPTRFAAAWLHHRRDRFARERSTDGGRRGIFHFARCEWERRNFFRALCGAKRSRPEIELARSWIPRCFPAGGTVSAIGWIRREMESVLLRPRLSAIVDEHRRESALQ